MVNNPVPCAFSESVFTLDRILAIWTEQNVKQFKALYRTRASTRMLISKISSQKAEQLFDLTYMLAAVDGQVEILQTP